MPWIQLVTLLAIVQFFAFGGMVAKARTRYGVKAPATTGNEMFERYHRVHMNTLEILVLYLPSLWIAATYWPQLIVASIGAIYLLGCFIYQHGYVADPSKRGLGYGISILPTVVLFFMALIGVIRSLIA